MSKKANNYDLKTRDIIKAGQFCLNNYAKSGQISYSSARTYAQRWAIFAESMKDNGIKKLEYITPDLVRNYGEQLADRVQNGELRPGYAQDLVGSVNRVMDFASGGNWSSVCAVRDCGIASNSRVRTQPPDGQSKSQVRQAAQAVSERVNPRAGAVVELARDFGLRSEEASLINAQKATLEAEEKGQVTITEGTKNGRPRTLFIKDKQQIDTLRTATEIQGNAKSMIDPKKSWKEWREQDLDKARGVLKEHDISRLHELRAAYLVERYADITGQQPPVISGAATNDKEARKIVAEEAGHSDIETTNAYLGGRR